MHDAYDCNNFNFGIYLCNSGVKNIPLENWCTVISAKVDSTAVQIAFMLFEDIIFKRKCAAGNWTDWEQIRTPPALKTVAVTLRYKNSTEMYTEVELAGYYPISLAIHKQTQTPYDAVKYTTVTCIGDTIKCSAVGGEFVNGHLLAGTVYCV